MTESEMVNLCRVGDRNAQRELFERTSERIYHVIYRMTGEAETAFDLAQNTYLRAFTRINQFDGRSSVATWLYRIAVTETLQHFRREKTHREKIQPLLNEHQVADTQDHADVAHDLQAALDRLEPLDRTMLLLRYQDGLNYRSIAELVGCAEGTVASRLNRARARLREILESGYGTPEGNVTAGHLKDGAGGIPASQDGSRRENSGRE